MTIPILATKLYIPPPRPDIIPRTRLTKQLISGLTRKLTLISAPAGFGKTTLLSDWVGQIKRGTQVAWLSLDEGDNDLPLFSSVFQKSISNGGKRYWARGFGCPSIARIG